MSFLNTDGGGRGDKEKRRTRRGMLRNYVLLLMDLLMEK